MTRQELTFVGQRLFGLKSNGYGWAAEMARQLGISDRTVSGWGKRKTPVPSAIAALLLMLDKERSR